MLRRPQPRADASEQLLEHERLRDVVVGAAVEARHGVDDLVAGREDDHGKLLAAGAERAQHGQAVLAGQADVEASREPPATRITVSDSPSIPALSNIVSYSLGS